jgi:CDP-diacylglycerol--serine O-phosphatidyltransferase
MVGSMVLPLQSRRREAELGLTPEQRRERRRLRRQRRRRKTLATLPTLLTLGNLLCGFMAVFIASRPVGTELPFGWAPVSLAAVLVLLGMVCDALDGRVARLTRSTSDLGEQLDSMADMVTFGVAPAFIALTVVGVQTPFVSESPNLDTWFDRLGLMSAAAFVACAALRLARFNAELNQQDDGGHIEHHQSFTGLPSPAAAGTVVTLAHLHAHFLGQPESSEKATLIAAGAVVAATLLCALAMVSRFKYQHLLNRYMRGRAPYHVIGFAVIALLLLAVYPQLNIALAFLAYAFSAPITSAWMRIRRLNRQGAEKAGE